MSDVGFDEMVEIDYDYIENQSAGRDMDLILWTVKTMFTDEGTA